MRKKFVCLKVLLCLGVLSASLAASAQSSLRLALVENSHVSELGGKVLQKALLGAGLSVQLAAMPSARATLEARAGRIDGEVARIASFADNYPELLRVEPSYLSFHTVAYGKNKGHLTVRSTEDLKGYKVGIVRGIQHAEKAVEGVAELTRVADIKQLLRMLDAGRVDIAVDTRLNGEFMLKQLGLKDISELGVLGQKEVFLYLNVQHRSLLPNIGKTLQKLKNSGELAKLVQSAEADF